MAFTSIADRLRELRAEKGLNQEEVAEACGMSRIGLARYETGARIPRAEYVSRLADFYGVTVDYLMGRDDTPPVQPKTEVAPATKAEDILLEIYRELNEENRRQTVQFMEFMRQKNKEGMT